MADTTEDMSFDLLEGASLASWLTRSRAEYIDERVRSGEAVRDATANADASIERSFPGGSPAEGQLVGRLKVGDRPVGWLWVGPFGADPTQWWVWNVEITEGERGRGYGRGAMQLAEELAASRGAVTIGLNVFAHNRVARNLYTSLGFEETSVQMRKDLASPR